MEHDQTLESALRELAAVKLNLERAVNLVKFVESNLTNVQPHIPQACYPKHAVFIDNYLDPVLEAAREFLAESQSPKQLPAPTGAGDNEMAAFVSSLTRLFPKDFSEPQALRFWHEGHESSLVWKARAALDTNSRTGRSKTMNDCKCAEIAHLTGDEPLTEKDIGL